MTLTESFLVAGLIGGYAYMWHREVKPEENIWKPKNYPRYYSNEFRIKGGKIESRLFFSGKWKQVFKDELFSSSDDAKTWLLRKYPEAKIIE